MNVNMVEHQRSILSTLGIDLWVPKVDAQTRAYSPSLYRDQAAPEVHHFQDFDIKDKVSLEHDPVNAEIAGQNTDTRNLETGQSTQKTLKQNNADDFKRLESGVEVSHEVREAIYVAPFELQSFSVEKCTIVIDATVLTSEQAQLWYNIQQAKSGHFNTLKWPFGLLPFQDGRGVHAYIQGFLDAQKMDKKLIALGVIPHLQAQEVLVLPSLQDMLEKPLLKRELWKLM